MITASASTEGWKDMQIPDPLQDWLKVAQTLFPEHFLELGAWETIFYPREATTSYRTRVERFITWTRQLAHFYHASKAVPGWLPSWLEQIARYLDAVFRYLQPWEYDPLWKNVFGGLDRYLDECPWDPERQVKGLIAYLENLPPVLITLSSTVKYPTRAHLHSARIRLRGMIEWLEELPGYLPVRIRKADIPASLWTQLENARTIVLGRLRSFYQSLEDRWRYQRTWTPERLPETTYRMLWFAEYGSVFTPEQVLKLAEEELQKVREQVREVLTNLSEDFGKKPVEAFRKIARQYAVSVREWMPGLRKLLEHLREFVVRHSIVGDLQGLPPLQVRETPPYLQGQGAGASVQAPGLFSPASRIYYNVDPLERLVPSPEQQKSFLREYNRLVLEILNIHEAYPGHYVQLACALTSAHPWTMLFPSSANVEGWAVYAEDLMRETGWNEEAHPDPYDQRAWEAFFGKWRLREISNAILDIRFHLEGVPEKEYLRFLTQEAFQEEAEARLKLFRQKLSAVQLTTYFVGWVWLHRLRSHWKKRYPSAPLREFHKWFLEWGPLPIPVLQREFVWES